MGKEEKRLQGFVTGIFVLLCVIFFQFFSSDHLFQKEEIVSLVDLPGVLSTYLAKPAWLSCSLSRITNSLFIPIGGGAFSLTIVLLLEWYAFLFVLRKFHVGEMAPLFALIPVVLEWGTYCSPSYHLSYVFSLTILLYLFGGYTMIKSRRMSMVIGFVMLFVVYDLVGSRLYLFVILVLLYEAEIGEKRWGYWILLLLAGIVLPELLRGFFSLTQDEAYQYPHPWLPAFFPAIALGFVLFATQIKELQQMKISACSVSVTTGFLLLLLSVTAFSHTD